MQDQPVGSVSLLMFTIAVGDVIIWWYQLLYRPIRPARGGQNGQPPPGQRYIYHSTPEHWSKLLVKSRSDVHPGVLHRNVVTLFPFSLDKSRTDVVTHQISKDVVCSYNLTFGIALSSKTLHRWQRYESICTMPILVTFPCVVSSQISGPFNVH